MDGSVAVHLSLAIPLEKASTDATLVQQEWDDMVEYAKQYLNLVQDDYKVLWWKIFNSVDAKVGIMF